MAVIEVPDWMRAIAIVGKDSDGDFHVLGADADGNLIALLTGDDSGTLRTLAVDSDGQLFVLIKGPGGEDIAVDANGFLSATMKGTYGATLKTLAVDADGNLISVVKGDYGGTLKTLTTDDAGRLQIVPYDPDDIWGNAVGMGNAELAGLLSPAKRFDRRGNVYHIDSFDNGIGRVSLQDNGAGSLAVLSAVAARTGSYSIAATHGPDTDRSAGFSTEIPHYTDTNVGGEISFTKNAWIGYFTFFLTEYEDGTYYAYGLRWSASDDKIQYYDSNDAWQDTGKTLPIYTSGRMFNTMKLVIDQTNHKYIRWMLNNASGSLASIAPSSDTLAIDDHLHVSALAYGTAAGASTIYIDDLIVTQNEPA